MKIINFPGTESRQKNCGNKQNYLCCELTENKQLNEDIFKLSFKWHGPAPLAGQFFMIKSVLTSVFLGRPISVAGWNPAKRIIEFLIAVRGTGTKELSMMLPGDFVQLTGPLGNTWQNWLSIIFDNSKPIALIGGGIGTAPLRALAAELPENCFDFFAGFRTGFLNDKERQDMLGIVSNIKTDRGKPGQKLIIATEDGTEGYRGFITDFFEPQRYAAVCACGPEPMLKKISAMCKKADVYCFVSMERRMACGIGACLGCTIKAKSGYLHCCSDGPIFPAEELRFEK